MQNTSHRGWCVAATLVAMLATGGVAAQTPVLTPLWQMPLQTTTTCGHDMAAQRGRPIQTDEAGNVYVGVGDMLASFTRDGVPRWRIDGCLLCDEPGVAVNLSQFLVLPDGHVWAIETRGADSEFYQFRAVGLHRINASGTVTASYAFGPDGPPWSLRPVLVQLGNSVVSLTLTGNTLHVFHAVGTYGYTTHVPLSIHRDAMRLVSAASAANGDALVELSSFDTSFCPGGLPCNRPSLTGLLRLSPDGSIAWRRDIEAVSEVTFDDNGNAWMIGHIGGLSLDRTASDGNLYRTRIAAQADLHMSSIISAPVSGRVLAAGAALESFGVDGQHVARLEAPQEPYVYPWDPYGLRELPSQFLMPLRTDTSCHNAVLYDPRTLQEQLRLHVDSVQCDLVPIDIRQELHPVHTRFASDDDGSVYFVRQECREGRPGPVIGRFGLPGTPAGGLLMRDGFENP